MSIKAVFSDIDGTLLNDQHMMTENTRLSIQSLLQKDIKFVLVSGRSPSGIYSVLNKYKFNCPIIAYSGSIILDENKNIIYEKGMTIEAATKIIDFIKKSNFNLTLNLFSFDDWITENRNNPEVKEEEKASCIESIEGDINSLKEGQMVHDILCMCHPDEIFDIEEKISKKFPEFTVVKSSKTYLEIMMNGVNKANAVSHLCKMWNIDMKDVLAFGDNYNDVEMLESVGHGIAMGNAPESIKNRIKNATLDNNHDGLAFALKKYF